jgi:hypothetical protein
MNRTAATLEVHATVVTSIYPLQILWLSAVMSARWACKQEPRFRLPPDTGTAALLLQN